MKIKTVLNREIIEIKKSKFDSLANQFLQEFKKHYHPYTPPGCIAPDESWYPHCLPVCRVNDILVTDLYVMERANPYSTIRTQYFPLDEVHLSSPETKITK